MIVGLAFVVGNRAMGLNEVWNTFLGLMFGMGAYWFLKACFLCYVLAYLSEKTPNKHVGLIMTLVLSQFLPWYNVWLMYPCFVIGMVMRTNGTLFTHIKKYNYLYLFVFLILLFFWNEAPLRHSKGVGIALLNITNSYTETYNATLFYSGYRFLIGIIGSCGIIGTFLKIIPQDCKNGFVNVCSDWGHYTLGVYLMDSVFTGGILPRIGNMDDMNFLLFNFIVTPAITCLFIAFCVYFIKRTSKYGKVSFLLWGK